MRFPAIGSSRFAGRCSPRSCLGPCRPVSRLLGDALARSHALVPHSLNVTSCNPRLTSATRSPSIHGLSINSTSLQIEHRAAEHPAQSFAIPTSTPHATQRIPKKQAAGMLRGASNSAIRHACSVGCEALAIEPHWPIVSLWARSYYRVSSLRLARLRSLCALNVSLTVSLACRPRFLARWCTAPQQRYHPQQLWASVYPLSLGLAWPPSWRSCSVVQRPGQLASCRLTCGRKILDSINKNCYATAVSLSIISPLPVKSTTCSRVASRPCPLC
jgi:hypothetical protein